LIEGPKGVRRIADALKKLRVNMKGRVVTSRDKGMDQVRLQLRRPDQPPGFESWQLPVKLDGPAFFYITVASPGAVVPEHAHERDLLRMVISGSILIDDLELKPGDWMFVPKGVPYSYSAPFNPGAICWHSYG
jgi:uncharacterized protein YegJ (DUF2314 family)